MKTVLNNIAYWSLLGVWYALSLLPMWVHYLLSDVLYLLVAYVLRYRHRVIWKNLSNAYPHKSEQERKRLLRQFYRHFCDVLVETVKSATIRRSNMMRRMTFKGVEEVAEILNSGQSVALLLGGSLLLLKESSIFNSSSVPSGSPEEQRYDLLQRRAEWADIVSLSTQQPPQSLACRKVAVLARYRQGMEGGSLTSGNGDMFYITNTACTIDLSGVEIVNEDSEANLMTVTGNDASHGWGQAGANGAQAAVTCESQELEGDIVVDTISTLDLTLESSHFTGTVNITDNEAQGEAVADNAVITVGEDSTWTLTGDCTVTSVDNSGTIEFNGYTITLADGTVLSE